ncbi:MAG TPA: tetratricopeptide repeat protein [Dehalococcoidia bacterium]|jgi:tetratricopeptide (TPR) repeat protein|nr:tetratricopeptide repeat protein [Dehalococcoidia bacterium]
MNSPLEGEEDARLKRQGSDQAIQLALESKWEEAAALNRAILEAQPNDVDTWNRLGKSLLELGRYREAHDAYGKSLQLDPVNSIAKRNLDRLAGLQDAEAPRREAVAKVAQDLFIEEVGKSGSTVLRNTPRETLATLTAGDEVYLRPESDTLQIASVNGDVLGSVEPKLGLRLMRLIQGGNQYAAAVKSLSESDVEVIIKEIYRDPSQTRLSFPATGGGEGVRPYIKESLLRLSDDDDDDLIDDDTENEDWDTEPDAGDGNVSLSGLAEVDSDDEEEEE